MDVAEMAALMKVPVSNVTDVIDILEGRRDPWTVPGVNEYFRHHYNKPEEYEVVMQAANILLEGFGVEGTQDNDGEWLTYVNTGETYALTLVHYQGKYEFTSWGDVVKASGFEGDL